MICETRGPIISKKISEQNQFNLDMQLQVPVKCASTQNISTLTTVAGKNPVEQERGKHPKHRATRAFQQNPNLLHNADNFSHSNFVLVMITLFFRATL